MQTDPDAARIAIIGMSCRVPDANDADEFWSNIASGRESMRALSEDELLERGVPRALLENPDYVRCASSLERVDLFDADFFAVSAAEAEIMDPQQRLFLECSYHALENAGYASERYRGTVGVFAGCAMSHYLLDNLRARDGRNVLRNPGVLQGNDKDFLTATVSHRLNLRGPCVSINTACSTSLVAVVRACQSLLSFECDLAMAGGARIALPHAVGYRYKQGGIFSPDGKCRPFDAKATGTVFGDGAGVVVLKRLDAARADGDTIHAVIVGSAVNNDGHAKVGFAAPALKGQTNVIREALEFGDIDPESVGYVEAHGTGTATGDPIEIAALSEAFHGRTRRRQFCAVGSVKSNIGHLVNAAGIAGLIKAVQALRHRRLPPSLHFEQPNPQIDFTTSPFYVNTTLADWPRNPGQPRRAGVSSFGIGGSNAHVVLEEAPPADSGRRGRRWQLLTLSGKSESAVFEQAARLADCLQRDVDLSLEDVAYTLHVGRGEHPYRSFLVCADRDAAISGLRHLRCSRVEARLPAAQLNSAADAPRDLEKLGTLWQAGAEVDWAEFHAGKRHRRVPLPAYPFERKRYWIDGHKSPAGAHFKARAGSHLSRESHIDRWFYQRVWKDASRARDITANAVARKSYIVFEDSCGLGERLSRRLADEGHEIVRVRFGEGFARQGDGFVVNPASLEDYGRLLSSLPHKGSSSWTIVHCAAFSAPGSEPWHLDEAWLDRGVCGLIVLAQALQTSPAGRETSLRIVGNEMFDAPGGRAVRPEKSMLASLARVMRQEVEGLHCQCIDLGECDPASAAALLCEELPHPVDSEVIVLDARRRLRPSYDRIALPEPEGVPGLLRPRGTYLLTGGLGGVALTIAGWLAERVQANLVLVSRTQSAEGKDWPRRVAQIEAAGGKVATIAADIADSGQLQDALGRARARFGAIHGVIHAAGVPSEETIARKTRARVTQVLRPKVHGTYALSQALRNEELDFFLMCSSISSITGGVGQADYSAANAFQNAFAALHAGHRTRYISICWDTWSQSGMAANARVAAHLQAAKERELSYGLSDREAIQVLARVLGAPDLHQVIVSTRDLEARLHDGSSES